MKKTIYKYFFSEFIRYFCVVLFALVAIIWTIQAVNFLDLVIDDGHAFRIYFLYSFIALPKILTKLIPFTFLIALVLTILKLEKDNELIVLWTSGLNKIHIVNLIFRISITMMIVQLVMTSYVTPKTLNVSRNILKNSELQFVPSLLKERQFNDTVRHLTIFVDKKNTDGTYDNILIRDEKKILTQLAGDSTIFAKKGYVKPDDKILVLMNGNIQRLKDDGTVSIIKFDRTELVLSGLKTKTTPQPKIQETSTNLIIQCLQGKKTFHNCKQEKNDFRDAKIEINKRFGMPMFTPLIALVCCFLLSSRKERKMNGFDKYFYFFIGFIILVSSELSVRYSGNSLNHTIGYYLIPIGLLPIFYLFLIRTFKYENLN